MSMDPVPTLGSMDRPVSFTLDFEDLRTDPTVQEERVGIVTDRILDRLGELGVKGTFFCVGELASRHPELIRRVVADGHELGVHGLHHIPNDLLGPERFRSDNREAKAILSELAGTEVTLYRAPQYSLIPSTPWVPELLTELGFIASSSVLPARSPLYGWPGAPTTPFRWPSGLIELPSPVMKVGPATIPFLGGTYLRLLPAALRNRGVRNTDPDVVLWSYCHPWEFDPDEKFSLEPSMTMPSPVLHEPPSFAVLGCTSADRRRWACWAFRQYESLGANDTA